MAQSKQNLTLVLDEDVLLAAQRIALEQRTCVNQLVREYLLGLVKERDRRQVARSRLKEAMQSGLVEIGERTWRRDDLYER